MYGHKWRDMYNLRKARVSLMGCYLRKNAREHFENSGLSYGKIKRQDIEDLIRFLKIELARYLVFGGAHALQMDMSVSKLRQKDISFNKKGLVYAYIEIDGVYFERREGITFNPNGFIGFGAEFSDCNVAPILEAFNKWCDHITTDKK